MEDFLIMTINVILCFKNNYKKLGSFEEISVRNLYLLHEIETHVLT